MAGKAVGAYLTISEVSEKLDVPSHVLRFWETKFNQLKPLKRGGGRRYYREADIDLLVRIRTLLYQDGFTIKGAQKALKTPDNAKEAPSVGSVGVSPEAGDDKASGAQKAATTSVQAESNSSFDELREALVRAASKIDALIAKQG